MRDEEGASLASSIKRIRTERRLSQGHVAERAGLSREGYRNVESGAVEPKVATLSSIARALDVPLEQLFVPARVLTCVRFRAQKKLNSREEVLSRVARQLDHYQQLEELLAEPKHSLLGKLQKRLATLAPDSRPEEAAKLARQALGLSDDELIRDICGLLEDNGIKVLTAAVATDGFFGLSVGDADGGPAVAINTWERISVERWIFTAAHELGHLLLHLGAYHVASIDEDETQEKEADVFASHFLIPESVFAKELAEARGLSLYDCIFKLKRIFRVSYRSVLYRIASKIPAADRKRVWIQFNVEFKRRNSGRSLPGTVEPEGLPPDAFFRRPAGKGSEEPERLERHDFVEDRLARLTRRALEDDLISLGKAAEVLDLSLEDMRDLSNSWVE
ncbi:MAG: XRE family transcriptional regulator [Polyangiaceae bacterium]